MTESSFHMSHGPWSAPTGRHPRPRPRPKSSTSLPALLTYTDLLDQAQADLLDQTQADLLDRIEEQARVDDVLRALSHPARRFVLELLEVDDAPAMHLADAVADRFAVSRARGSHHVSVLRKAQVVTMNPDWRERYHRINPHGMEEVRRWMDKIAALAPPR